MEIKYKLNLKLLEIGVVMASIARWHGLLKIEDELTNLLGDMDSNLRDFIKYAIDLVLNGTDPVYVDFLLNEELKTVERLSPDNLVLLKDIRLMKFIIQQIQLAQGDSIQILLNSIDDQQLRSQYKNWADLNQYDYRVTFDDSIHLTSEARLGVINSNPMVKKYYEDMFKR